MKPEAQRTHNENKTFCVGDGHRKIIKMPTPRESQDWKTETGTKLKHTQTTMANGSNEMVSGTTCKRFTPRIKIPNGPSEMMNAINACNPVTLPNVTQQT